MLQPTSNYTFFHIIQNSARLTSTQSNPTVKMRFTARFLAISAALSQVLALPVLTDSSYAVVEGKAFEITWANATGAVTLSLKNGASTDLGTVATIACKSQISR